MPIGWTVETGEFTGLVDASAAMSSHLDPCRSRTGLAKVDAVLQSPTIESLEFV